MYKLNPLPYSFESLEPVIDAQTMQLHHDKHHQTYVDKLNEALAGQPELSEQPVEQLIAGVASLPAELQTAVRNFGGGHANHELFWSVMKPVGESMGESAVVNGPTGELADKINATFGVLADFEKAFTEAAVKLFGSGWVWLIQTENGELQITTTANQDSPLMKGLVKESGQPLLCLDVWEHAYYLKYQNKRADYVQAWWQVVNWEAVAAIKTATILKNRA